MQEEIRARVIQGALATSLSLLGCLVTACGGGTADTTSTASSAPGTEGLSEAAELGRLIFADVTLSASGQQACASCHAAGKGHAPDNSLPAQLGGPSLQDQGNRNAPTLRYLATNKPFALDADGTPRGGFFWDGRAASLQEQARQPFLNPLEMANASAADFTARLARASYAARFAALYGADIFSRPDDALQRAALALQRYQLEDSDFAPFNSKFDQFLRGQAVLTAAETRGLAVFNDPAKGNCAACHPSTRAADGSHPLFTDFSYDNLGVPRNPALRVNDDATYFDLGLCSVFGGGQRTDLCGAFKVPTLRNVAVRGAFFHNGRFASLKDVLRFYATRDTQPALWYPTLPDGTVDRFNDVPKAWRSNVNTTEGPLNRQAGQAPAMTESDIDDLAAFLATLTDAPTP